MSTIFIADIHLCINKPIVIANFIYFLHNIAINAKSIYILGDLFEKWIGDDDLNQLHINIANELNILQKQNIPCYFINGNHDFLLSKKYTDMCGMIYLLEPQILDIFGYKIVILHGDALCIDDTKYQTFKKYINQIWIKKLFLFLPLSLRHFIYNKVQKYCLKQNKKDKDINTISMIKLIEKTQAKILIHGHTHKPKIHIFNIKSKVFYRIVLSNWNTHGYAIKLNKSGIFLIKFDFNLNHQYYSYYKFN